MGKVFNINGVAKNSIPIREARQYFPGREGNAFIDHRSLLQKIYRGDIPRYAFTKHNGVYWFDENYLTGFNDENNTAA